MLELLVAPISALLSKLIPDKDAREAMAHEIATLAEKQTHERLLAQTEVNKQEAVHKNVFVAGWRPMVGWVCAAAMANNFLILPYASAFIPELLPLDLDVMLPILMGMLGLGGMRSFEKARGVARGR